ncbi:unnamed protein product [Urochloa decumbens]|uniref:Uncharacterized protein n=1 Tax=Urochloa decumbens TaxID=240449 RepID=A0ABC8YTA0_9POAL
MARIKRHDTRRLWRRSREEKRRLSEGGGGTARQQTSEAVDDQSDSDLKVSLEDLTADEIDRAYHCVIHFDEVYGSLLLKEKEIRDNIEKLCQLKASVEEKIANLKVVIRSPDSQSIKKVKAAMRTSSEIQESIISLEQDLTRVRLNQTVAEANYSSCARVVNEDVNGLGDDLLFGFIGHVFR